MDALEEASSDRPLACLAACVLGDLARTVTPCIDVSVRCSIYKQLTKKVLISKAYNIQAYSIEVRQMETTEKISSNNDSPI